MLNFNLKYYSSRIGRVPLLRGLVLPLAALMPLLPTGAIAGELNLRFSNQPHHSSRSSIRVYSGSSGGSVRTYGNIQTHRSGHSSGTSVQLRIGDGTFESFHPHHRLDFGENCCHNSSRRYSAPVQPNLLRQRHPHYRNHRLRRKIRSHRPYRSHRVIIRDRVEQQFDEYGFRVYNNRSSKKRTSRY